MLILYQRVVCTITSTHREVLLNASKQTDKQTGRQTDRQTDRQADRQTDRQTDGQTYRQTDRQTDHSPFSPTVMGITTRGHTTDIAISSRPLRHTDSRWAVDHPRGWSAGNWRNRSPCNLGLIFNVQRIRF
jgi:hypothetical protein